METSVGAGNRDLQRIFLTVFNQLEAGCTD
jgi:hypothetical protein